MGRTVIVDDRRTIDMEPLHEHLLARRAFEYRSIGVARSQHKPLDGGIAYILLRLITTNMMGHCARVDFTRSLAVVVASSRQGSVKCGG